MGTTLPNPSPMEGGQILFWKLQAEAFLASSGVRYAIVKPCGLGSGPGSAATLVTGHHDDLLASPYRLVDRRDVARVVVAALLSPRAGLRFDLCSKPGPATADAALPGLLEASRWPWDQHSRRGDAFVG
eukprot:EG_transcript_22107